MEKSQREINDKLIQSICIKDNLTAESKIKGRKIYLKSFSDNDNKSAMMVTRANRNYFFIKENDTYTFINGNCGGNTISGTKQDLLSNIKEKFNRQILVMMNNKGW